MSDAFRALKASTKEILIQIYFEIDLTSKKKRGKYQPQIKNRYEIKMPYREIKERLGYSDKTIWLAFQQILAHGFLKIIENGGGCKGDVNVYGITEDWRDWKSGKVIRKIRKNGKAGWQKEKK